MAWDKRRGGVVTVLAVVMCATVAARFLRRTPSVRAPRQAAAYVHPIVPSAPVVHPAPPSCRARDLLGATAAVRQVGARAASSCADQAATGARIDRLAAAVSGCVARDAELDSQWNSVQAAVLELRACATCSAPRGQHCQRVNELLKEAEQGVN